MLDNLAWALSRLGEDPEEASRQMAALDPEGRSATERILIMVHRVAKLNEDCLYGEALDMARPLLEEARSEKDLALEVRIAMVLGGILYNLDIDEAVATLEPALELAAQAGDDVLEADANQAMCEILFEGERYELLLTRATAATEFAGRAGLGRWARPQLRFYLAVAQFNVGQLAESLETIRSADLDEPTGRARALLQVVAAQASTVVGAFGEAAAAIEASRLPNDTEEAELRRGWLATAKAELALAEGRLDDVRRIVQATAPRVLGDQLYAGMSDTVWWLVEIGLAAAAERAESARAAKDDVAMNEILGEAALLSGHLDQVRRQRDQAGVPDNGRHIGDEALIAGHLARIEDRDDPGLWVAAADAFPPRSPRGVAARYRQAEAMLAGKAPKDEIAAVMQGAHAAAADIGAQPLARRFETLARRARIEIRPAAAAAPAASVDPPPDESARAGHSRAARPGPERSRDRGPDPRRRRLLEPRHRDPAVHQRQDRQRPRLAYPRQARRVDANRGRDDRRPSRAAGR